jgi:xylulokinase
VFAQVRQVLLPKDWLRLQLTGELATDMSDASGTLWLETARRDWSDPMLAACGLDRSHMPRLLEGSAVSGWLHPQWCQRWGLPARVPVAAGAGDNAASAIGTGIVSAGQGFVSLGTSGVIFLVGSGYRSAPELAVHSFAHALPDQWHQMAVMLNAASAFAWVTRLTGFTSEAELAAKIDAMPSQRRHRAPLFLPYLQGERTPHNNVHARGGFFGLTSDHEATDLAYAVLEGVTLGLMDCWSAMGQGDAAGATPLTLVGGGARNNTWAHMMASGLRRTIVRPHDAHSAAAIGAARLGWLAVGGRMDDVCLPLPADAQFHPDDEAHAWLAARLEQFRALYASTCS